jgi:hypothetical protein
MRRPRVAIVLVNVVGLLALVAIGCGDPYAGLVQKEGSDPRPLTEPRGQVRTDGVYACRGILVVGSAGGLGFWPFQSRGTQIRLVEFLRFDADGNVQSVTMEAPASAREAAAHLRKAAADPGAQHGRYSHEGEALSFVINARGADGQPTSPVPYHGKAYHTYLALTADSAVGPIYREYNFEPAD